MAERPSYTKQRKQAEEPQPKYEPKQQTKPTQYQGGEDDISVTFFKAQSMLNVRSYARDKKWRTLLSIAPGEDKKYRWDDRISFNLSPTEIGAIMLFIQQPEEYRDGFSLIHDPASYGDQGPKKIMNMSFKDETKLMISLKKGQDFRGTFLEKAERSVFMFYLQEALKRSFRSYRDEDAGKEQE